MSKEQKSKPFWEDSGFYRVGCAVLIVIGIMAGLMLYIQSQTDTNKDPSQFVHCESGSCFNYTKEQECVLWYGIYTEKIGNYEQTMRMTNQTTTYSVQRAYSEESIEDLQNRIADGYYDIKIREFKEYNFALRKYNSKDWNMYFYHEIWHYNSTNKTYENTSDYIYDRKESWIQTNQFTSEFCLKYQEVYVLNTSQFEEKSELLDYFIEVNNE